MSRRLPKYVHGFVDRHGKARHYFRREGVKRIALPGLPYSSEFMGAYEAAKAGQWIAPQIGVSRTVAGTVNASLIAYWQSPAFLTLGEGTRKSRRAILERLREQHGDKRIANLETRHVENVILAGLKPWAARNWLKAIRHWLAWCARSGLCRTNAARDVKLSRPPKSDGFRPWTEADVVKFVARHSIGTKAYLALAIYLYAGLARADAVRVGRQHMRDGLLTQPRKKTGVEAVVGILPELTAAIAATPEAGDLTLLLTEQGRAFTAAGFGNWFADRCREAGVPGRAHGLRKLAATRMAEAGATDHELMAWFGWRSISEAQRYTRAADRKKLARSGGAKLISGTRIGKPKTRVANSAAKSLKTLKARK